MGADIGSSSAITTLSEVLVSCADSSFIEILPSPSLDDNVSSLGILSSALFSESSICVVVSSFPTLFSCAYIGKYEKLFITIAINNIKDAPFLIILFIYNSPLP